jgi:DNA-directed RNA polymerase subunit RPC12/RpoP
MYCLRCGVQLAPNYKEPLCAYCRSQIAVEEILKDPVWGLYKALEALSIEVKNLMKRVQELEKVYVKT